MAVVHWGRAFSMRNLTRIIAVLSLLNGARAQVTERVDVSSTGAQSNQWSDQPFSGEAVVSADGRFVAFISAASNLVPLDTNGTWDVFVRDRLNRTTELVSVATNGTQGNGFSGGYGIAMSPDGRFVVFESPASNLVPGDTNGARDIFLRDRLNGTTELISVATGGAQGNANSLHPSVSPDGRYVAFETDASNLVPGDTNGSLDTFVRDRLNQTTELVSQSSLGVLGNGNSELPSMSADGRYVVFDSEASNLVPGDTNSHSDVFVRDRQLGITTRLSINSAGIQGNGISASATLSADGRFVAYVSNATNLVTGDTNATWDVFVHDRRDNTTERVSVATGGAQGNGSSTLPYISPDGRFVAFTSYATNLVSGVNSPQAYLHDRQDDTTEVVSIATDGSLANAVGENACVAAGGRYVVFRSEATNLVPNDTNAAADVFIHDRDPSGFRNLCNPGIAGVISCPCGNPPSGPGHGCDNSSATGGASLSALGNAYLSIDSLDFTTAAERPTATSILLQGTSEGSSGAVYGQGVRCVAGVLKRLFTKTASSGSIRAPDFGAGDPTVSARSSALGDAIQPGQSRWYLVYYRDPMVLGGCPASSTFNSTQTGQVTWWP